MRPKVVLLIMLVAVAALGVLVVFRRAQNQPHSQPNASGAVPTDVTASGDRSASSDNQSPAAPVGKETVTDASASPSNAQKPGSQSPTGNALATLSPTEGQAPITNIVATTPEQDHQEAIEPDIDMLNEALLDGGSNPKLVQAVRDRLFNPDADVRKAAVSTIVGIDDRGAIPQLKQALAQVEDPREKVEIMDAIDYLQTPEGDPQFVYDPPPPGPGPTITNLHMVRRPQVVPPRARRK